MARRFAAALVCFTFAVAFVLGADETYDLKIKLARDAVKLQVSETKTKQSSTKVTDDKGAVLVDKTEKEGSLLVYQSTVAEKSTAKENPRPNRLTRAYEKAQATRDEKTTDLPYQGKTVLIEKKDGKYAFRIDKGDELAGAAAELLDREFNKPGKEDSEERVMQSILPKKPVRVDETWKVDVDNFAKDLEESAKLPVDVAKATGTGKLLRVYKKDGRQFGVMEHRIELPLKPGKVGALDLASGTVSLKFTVDCCIDGSLADESVVIDVKMSFAAKVELPGKKEGQLSVSVAGETKGSRAEIAK